MTHHTHTMESWLTIEKYIVSIFKIALNNHAVVEVLLDLIGLIVHLHKVNDVVVLLLVL